MTDEQLLPGERITPPVQANFESEPASDSQIEERYVRGEVRIVVEQARYPLKQVPEVVRSADYNLQPDFQRRPRWGREKQSRLIESLILNVPIPPVFLYEQDFGRYEVMDGRQRLTAIADYYADRFPLEGLEEWPELNGRRYSTLPDQVRRGIDRRFLSAIVLLHETAKSSQLAERLKQLVFERINTGGEDLSAQEKRNALYPGPMNRICVKLARNESLCRMWGIPAPTEEERLKAQDWSAPQELASNESYRTMEDAELVLRFFAHRQRASLWRGGTRFDEYLTTYLKAANGFESSVLESLESLFTQTADLTYTVLGDSAFYVRRPRGGTFAWIARPALSAYDPMMAAFSRLIAESDALISEADKIRNDLGSFYERNHAEFDGRKTNPADIRRRDELVYAFLRGYTKSVRTA